MTFFSKATSLPSETPRIDSGRLLATLVIVLSSPFSKVPVECNLILSKLLQCFLPRPAAAIIQIGLYLYCEYYEVNIKGHMYGK